MGKKIIENSDLTCIGKGYEFCFLFFGCQEWGAGVVPAIVSLIPSVFTKSFPLLSPWCWVDDYKRLCRCRSGNRPRSDYRGFLKTEKHFLCQLQIHNEKAQQSKTDITISIHLKDISFVAGDGGRGGSLIVAIMGNIDKIVRTKDQKAPHLQYFRAADSIVRNAVFCNHGSFVGDETLWQSVLR